MRLKASGPIEVIQFTDEEVENLAKIEHRRFVDERKAADWRFGETKDIENRISPYLGPVERPVSARRRQRLRSQCSPPFTRYFGKGPIMRYAGSNQRNRQLRPNQTEGKTV